jgi:D-alanyl-D-alanine carboxypeptidase
MIVSQPGTVYELTDLSKSIARGAFKTTMEQQGGTWEGQSRTSHSSEITPIQQTYQAKVQSMPLSKIEENFSFPAEGDEGSGSHTEKHYRPVS